MLTVGSLFSGIGLLDYGLHLAGIEHRWLCEWDEWRRGILAKRWPGARVLDDVRDAGHGCEPVDLIAGGFPCKGASTAGPRNGFEHPETVLWREMRRAIGELRPRYVLVENVANLLALHDGAVWGEVLGDLAALRFDVVWDCLPAAAVGAPHLRDRVFAVATNTDGPREGRDAGVGRFQDGRTDARGSAEDVADPGRERGELRGGPRALAGASGPVEGEAQQWQRARHAAGRGGEDAPDASGERREPAEHEAQQPGLQPDAGRVRRETHAFADASGTGRQGTRPGREALGRTAPGRGVAVDWAEYRHAIRRWEAVHGPAPEPLVRRMDDRDAARVERSRLSALGDGVQVQVGRIAGEYIVGLERERLRRAAA